MKQNVLSIDASNAEPSFKTRILSPRLLRDRAGEAIGTGLRLTENSVHNPLSPLLRIQTLGFSAANSLKDHRFFQREAIVSAPRVSH